MKKETLLLLLTMALLGWAGTAFAQEITISSDGRADYATLTEAVAAAQPGDTLVLKEGIYAAPAESFPIVVDKPLTILGEGTAVLDSPRFTTILEITVDEVSVTGVSFLVRKWGIVAAQSRGMTLDGCTFTLAEEDSRTSSTAVWMEAMEDCSVLNCAFEGVGVCMAGDPLSESSSGKAVLTGLCEVGEERAYFVSHRFENCTVNGKPLYYITDGKDVTVPSDAGGVIAAYCDGITVKDADVSDSSMGLEIVHSRDVVLDHVTADRCGIFGTYVAFAEGGTIKDVTVSGTNHGIDTRASRNVTVEGCLADGCEQGIFFSMCTGAVMRDCDVRGCGFGCFTAKGSGMQIIDCRLDANADGIYLQNEQETAISDCMITASTVVGLRILKSSGLCENTALQGNWTGVIIYDSEGVTIRGCTLDSNQAAGIYAGNAREMIIANCTFSGETTAHFEFEGSFRNASVTGCTLSGDSASMLRLKSDEKPAFLNNDWIKDTPRQISKVGAA
ncbi:MAG: right-handed parallel beta-helix repeat-containing protein [Eubacteriales bacterium]|nr:right-handed parallel beta-helix repeat-containing protein [Eubacteriales bacterium]